MEVNLMSKLNWHQRNKNLDSKAKFKKWSGERNNISYNHTMGKKEKLRDHPFAKYIRKEVPKKVIVEKVKQDNPKTVNVKIKK